MPSKAPDDSNRFERGIAMVLRCFLFLLAAYIVFHKIFPFGLFRTRLADMTGADLLLLIVRSLVATIGAAFFVVTGFIQPALHDRDRLWCERWTGLAFGVIAIAVGSVLISILEKKGIIIIAAHWVAICILAAVLALRFLHPLEASLRFRTPQPTRFQGRMDRRGRSCPRASAMRGLAVQMHRQLRRRCTR